ncbi:histidine phosphatase family protein [Geobacter sp. SVR]|uniref:SixA phosphatase family protein n=1 Tax=Geobacter sp. SVR TaxID=2495594 RepID=UPI00143EFC3C|nr:histidine phosphatase family protein [Geobacter sp. SVR]BCS55944.1 phosphohistidine phosphatase [Geobacter sp. SVR]GCF84707.1 phosphohistidine phosphatase [Geobacter sp. SVR]
MVLYVVRHAEAVEESETLRDEWRYLTEKGRSVAGKMSAAIAKLGPKPRLTITSPLTRAVQTAEIAAEKACRRNVIVASELLAPGADINELIAHLKECQAKRVMLVGHEPQLGLLVAALLDRRERVISPKKGACIALEFDPDRDKPAGFLWYLAPGKKLITSLKKAFADKRPDPHDSQAGTTAP